MYFWVMAPRRRRVVDGVEGRRPVPSKGHGLGREAARRAIACALKLVSGASLGQAIQDGKLVEWATFLVRSDGCTVLAYQTHTSSSSAKVPLAERRSQP